MRDAEIPFHNNDSEKAIRQAKVKQKVSEVKRESVNVKINNFGECSH